MEGQPNATKYDYEGPLMFEHMREAAFAEGIEVDVGQDGMVMKLTSPEGETTTFLFTDMDTDRFAQIEASQ